jgi:hypothetical protein
MRKIQVVKTGVQRIQKSKKIQRIQGQISICKRKYPHIAVAWRPEEIALNMLERLAQQRARNT